jgi:hypothetical protein
MIAPSEGANFAELTRALEAHAGASFEARERERDRRAQISFGRRTSFGHEIGESIEAAKRNQRRRCIERSRSRRAIHASERSFGEEESRSRIGIVFRKRHGARGIDVEIFGRRDRDADVVRFRWLDLGDTCERELSQMRVSERASERGDVFRIFTANRCRPCCGRNFARKTERSRARELSHTTRQIVTRSFLWTEAEKLTRRCTFERERAKRGAIGRTL